MKNLIAPIIVVSPLVLVSIVFLSSGCRTQPEQAKTRWEYQTATNNAEADQMMDKGWRMEGFSKYTDATGQPQTDYMMKRTKR